MTLEGSLEGSLGRAPLAVELDWLKRWALYAPDKTALLCAETGVAKSYAQLYTESVKLASVLRLRFAVGHGDRVACLAQNELEYISLFFALSRLVAILVPINFRFTAAEVLHVVRDCDAKLVVAQSAFWNVLADLRGERALWNFDGPDSLQLAVATGRASLTEIATETEDRADHRANGRAENGFEAGFEDTCMILYTSGTTGFPKGAMISHRMIFWNSINTGLRLNLTQHEVVATFLPLFHTGGWNVLTTPCLHRGAKVVLLRKFDPELLLQVCAREKVSVLFGVPTTMDLLRRHVDFADTDLSSIRYAVVGGEPMPLESIGAWEARGIPVRQGYGLTEFGPNVFSLNEEDSRRKVGSIGFPNFYIDARVVDDGSCDVVLGEVGELILRGPVTMSGYWNNRRATDEVLRDGWLHTGDLVRQDDEGFYFVVGRKKEMFISGGENVYPAEVEKVLRQLPGVREVAVIGVPNLKWGESGKAFLSLNQDALVEVGELRAHCVSRLAKFKIPLEFVFMDELPKTESGKIAKRELR